MSDKSNILRFPAQRGVGQQTDSAQSNIDEMSLDEYVCGNFRNGILYVQISGNKMNALGLFDGDLVVARKDSKPDKSDLVLVSVGVGHGIRKFSEMKSKQNKHLEIIGVISHVLKTLKD